MMDPRVLLVIVAIGLSVWVGDEAVKGAKWVGHKVQSAVHHVLHPHETETGARR